MPSPFPGMDPYLEDPAGWGGVHARLIYVIQAELNRVLPDGYIAEIDLYVWAGEQPHDEPIALRRKPDVFLPAAGTARKRATPARVTGGVAVAPPTTLTRMPERHVRQSRRVRIVTADGAEVVTVLELLSPSNKRPGEDRTAYLAKRGEYFASRANFVEVDLLRDGDRMPMGEPRPPVADYYVFVSPPERNTVSQVWAWGVTEPIPTFGVPLRTGTAGVALDLRRCLDRVYDEGRYSDKIEYRRPPVPPLGGAAVGWAADLLKAHPRRRKAPR